MASLKSKQRVGNKKSEENSKEKYKKDPKQKIVYIDILRILACVLVIVNHIIVQILNHGGHGGQLYYSAMISFCKIGVPIFLMITGALVLRKEYGYKKILKNIIRVAIPAVILSLYLYIREQGISNFSVASFISALLQNPILMPLWYIYALIGIYLVLPFVQKMVKNFTERDYLIFIVICLIFPSILSMIAMVSGYRISGYLTAAIMPTYIGALVAGDYLAHCKISKKSYWVSILSIIVTLIGMTISTYRPVLLLNDAPKFLLDSWNVFPVIVLSLATFYIVRYLFETAKMNEVLQKIIGTIAATTFGIYLIHPLFTWRIYKINVLQAIYNTNSIVGSITHTVAVFVVCMVIVYILKKIPIIRNYL